MIFSDAANGPVPDESALPFCLLYLLYEGAHDFEIESGNFIETARLVAPPIHQTGKATLSQLHV